MKVGVLILLEIQSENIHEKKTISYDDKYILKNLMAGKTREEIAKSLNHKSFRTLDMYMRRHGYVWDGDKQTYVSKLSNGNKEEYISSSSKVDKILHLFKAGIDPKEIAMRVGMRDHLAMADYMKSKGYMWSTKKQNYIFFKGQVSEENIKEDNINNNIEETLGDSDILNIDIHEIDKLLKGETYMKEQDETSLADRISRLLPMLEMMDRNKDKLVDVLAINDNQKIPRYVVGGVTITKSLCMAHPLSELIKEFSREKNISQREVFEVAIIEFLKKYGYEKEINALFLP